MGDVEEDGLRWVDVVQWLYHCLVVVVVVAESGWIGGPCESLFVVWPLRGDEWGGAGADGECSCCSDAVHGFRGFAGWGGEDDAVVADWAARALGEEDIDKPTLTVFLPVAPNATRTGVVVAPGGSYMHLAVEKEGYAEARWLNARGVAAFVLQYRLGQKYHYPVELEDAQRAIRTVRAHAAEWGVARRWMWQFSRAGI